MIGLHSHDRRLSQKRVAFMVHDHRPRPNLIPLSVLARQPSRIGRQRLPWAATQAASESHLRASESRRAVTIRIHQSICRIWREPALSAPTTGTLARMSLVGRRDASLGFKNRPAAAATWSRHHRRRRHEPRSHHIAGLVEVLLVECALLGALQPRATVRNRPTGPCGRSTAEAAERPARGPIGMCGWAEGRLGHGGSGGTRAQ
jgi:hypothetical protein